ncbi:MAG: asparaginase [Oscillospiraceae bacterium]|nr:asparaginase [Oscillospiraceae bacterium]
MKKILFIATGGTVSCGQTELGLTPRLSAGELLELVPELAGTCRISSVQPFSLDSTNMTPREWSALAVLIRNNYAEYDGFVIAHGTDTMAYGAAALSCLIQNSRKPVIFTGSQRSPAAENSDVKRNLRDALLCALDGNLRGVTVVFGGRIIDGRRACKLHTRELDAFRSINGDDIGSISEDGRVAVTPQNFDRETAFYDRLDERAAMIKLTPGAPVGIFDIDGVRAVIIESYGAGGLPEIYEGKLAELIEKGVYVIMSTQVPYGGSDLTLYRVGRVVKEKYGLIETGTITAEYAVMRTMWALAHSGDYAEFKRLFADNTGG